MLLLELPPELLRNAIQQSIPDGFENLMLSCKTLYECGQEFIEDYNIKVKECRTVSLSAFDNRTALYWLHRIAEEPSLSHYMRTVDLKGNKAYMHCDTLRVAVEELRKTPAYRDFLKLKENSAVLQRIGEFVASSPYIGGDEGFWTSKILTYVDKPVRSDDSDFFRGVFFLTLLPNVRTLTLPWNNNYVPWSRDETTKGTGTCHYRDVFDKIQRKARDLHVDAALGLVKRLEYLLETEYDVKAGLSFLSPFLVLPCLEELYATSLVATKFEYSFAWKYPDVVSNLRSIELVSCALDATGVSELLAHMPHLVSFKYSHGCKHHGLEAYWDAGAFVAAVGKHAGNRLQHLAITTEIRGLNEVMTGVTSLREFARLETLEVHYAYFCGPSIESGEQVFMGTPPNPGYEKWTIEAIPPLQQILPSSLKSFVLFVEPNSYCPISGAKPLFPLFNGFASAQASALPKLERCEVFCRGKEFGSDGDGRDVVYEYLKDEGISCQFGDGLEPPWRSAFKAQFVCELLDRE
ncbi:hypothetical protein F4810DRAFT_645549 [Camillea tinctor]|nr:hypothetical protein F4810DRAFT_645549 [Camillea tinctor]